MRKEEREREMPRQRLAVGEARSAMVFTLVKPRERDALDAVAEGQGQTRSSCIRQAVLRYVECHGDDGSDHN